MRYLDFESMKIQFFKYGSHFLIWSILYKIELKLRAKK